MSFAISIMIPDRVGVLRDITKTIFDLDGNIGDLRQMIVDGCFTLTCIATFPTSNTVIARATAKGRSRKPEATQSINSESIRSAIQSSLADGDIAVAVRPFIPPKQTHILNGERYVFTVQGPDKPGRVFSVSDFFAARGINVEDWSHRITSSGLAFNSGTVTVPPKTDIAKIQADFVKQMAKQGLTAKLFHENIFKATNDIGPIQSLLQH